MDTKARVIIIVAGVVLVGMVAWVLMPGGTTDAPVDQVVDTTLTPADTADQRATTPVPSSTQPYAAVDPFALPATLPAPEVNIGPSLTPADSTDAWARALDGSSTATPQNPSSNSLPARDAFSSNFTQSGISTNTTQSTVIPADTTFAAMPKTYVVASGDSLYSISEKIYGSAKNVSKIAAANPGVDPKRLKVGQTIKLPDLSSSSAVATPSATVTSSVAAAPAAKTYKVQPGDSLRKIATKVYGDSAKWEKLYSANRTLIGSDPSQLRAGMVLQVPAK